MAISLLVLVVAAYAAVATAYLEARRRREPPPRWARLTGPVAVAAHGAGLVALSMAMQRSPFASTSQALSFLAFSLVVLYLVLESLSHVASHGGGFYAAAACLAAFGVPGLIEGDAATWAAAPRDTARSLHIGLSLLCTAGVLAGGLLALGYLGTYARVKRRRLQGGTEGPSLHGFVRLSRGASLLSVLLLVPSVVLGAQVSASDTDDLTAAIVLAVTGAFLTAMLTGASFLWWRRPRRGALAAWLTLSSALLLIAAFGIAHAFLVGSGPAGSGP